jgi:hypothetical protein
MMRGFATILTAVLTAAPCAARAQTADSIGIRAQGMAGAFTAVADDATATWWNPAGLATGAFFNAVLEAGNDHHAGVSAAYPALGLSYYRLRINEVQAPPSTGGSSLSPQGGTPAPGLLAVDASQFGVTVGQSIGSYVAVASTLKLVRAEESTHGDLDIGAMAALGLARVGVTVRNVTSPTLGGGTDTLTLTRHVRAGAAIASGGASGSSQATVAFDADLTRVAGATGDERRMAIGGEAWTTSRRFGGRAGFSWSTLNDSRIAGTLGASLAIRPRIYFEVQTSYSRADDSRRSVGAALRMTF